MLSRKAMNVDFYWGGDEVYEFVTYSFGNASWGAQVSCPEYFRYIKI